MVIIASSCSIKPIDDYHGVAFLDEKQKKLSINRSNKNDILKILGAPSTESILEDDLWIYIENRKSKSSLILNFDKLSIIVSSIKVINFLISFFLFFKSITK